MELYANIFNFVGCCLFFDIILKQLLRGVWKLWILWLKYSNEFPDDYVFIDKFYLIKNFKVMKKSIVFISSVILGLGMLVTGASVFANNRHNSQSDELRQMYERTTILKEGDVAVDFTAEKYIGKKLKLSDFKGKVVLLNFWATWCGPCLKELAPEALPKELEEFMDDEDFVFLPVAYTENVRKLDNFFSTRGQRYKYLTDYVVIDPNGEIFSKYAVQGIPRSFVIGKDGRIVLGSLGSTPEEIERIVEAIEEALD